MKLSGGNWSYFELTKTLHTSLSWLSCRVSFAVILDSITMMFDYILLHWHLNNIDGLVQKRCKSIANALELRLSCTNPSTYSIKSPVISRAAIDFLLTLHLCRWTSCDSTQFMRSSANMENYDITSTQEGRVITIEELLCTNTVHPVTHEEHLIIAWLLQF